MKNIVMPLLLISFSFAIYAAEGTSTTQDPTRTSVSATPRLIRENPTAQVFFQEIPGSLQISTSGDYNRIMNALSIGLKKKMPVKMIVNKQTGIIVDIDAPVEQRDTTMYEEDIPVEKKEDKKAESKNETPALGNPNK